MENTIKDFTTQELVSELNRRYALEAKQIFDRRTAVTNFIREHRDVFIQLANVMEDEQLKQDIQKINDYVYNCVDLALHITDGKLFLDAIFKEDNQPVWSKYLKTESINVED